MPLRRAPRIKVTPFPPTFRLYFPAGYFSHCPRRAGNGTTGKLSFPVSDTLCTAKK